MAHIRWTGEEIFMHKGDFVFEVFTESNEGDVTVLVAPYPSGEPFKANWDDMESATPKQLKEIV